MAIYARKMIEDAIAAGYSVAVGSDGETDYKGTSAALAWKACTDLDEAGVVISKHGAKSEVALVIPGLAPDETLADFTADGWISAWFDQQEGRGR